MACELIDGILFSSLLLLISGLCVKWCLKSVEISCLIFHILLLDYYILSFTPCVPVVFACLFFLRAMAVLPSVVFVIYRNVCNLCYLEYFSNVLSC